MCTSVVFAACRPSYTLPGISVRSSSSAVLESTRATSSATLPLPIDGDRFGVELPGAGVVRVAVVPGDEIGGAVGAFELDAGDVEVGVLESAGGEDDRVVVGAQILEREVGAELDVAEEADVAAAEDPVQCGDDALDARVVRGDSVTDQPEGGGEAVEQVDRDLELTAFHRRGAQQGLGGVDAGGAGADHGQTEGLLGEGHLTSVSWRGGAGSDAVRSGRGILRPTSLCTDFRTTVYAKFALTGATVSGLTSRNREGSAMVGRWCQLGAGSESPRRWIAQKYAPTSTAPPTIFPSTTGTRLSQSVAPRVIEE